MSLSELSPDIRGKYSAQKRQIVRQTLSHTKTQSLLVETLRTERPSFTEAFRIPMEIKVNFLDKLRLEAKFDDFTVVADQPIR